MKRLLYILCLMALFLHSAHAQKGFSSIFLSSKTLKAQATDFPIDDLSRPYIMQYSGGILYFCNIRTSPLLTAFDWKTKRYIGEFGNKGQGPNEYLSFSTMSPINDQIGIFDSEKNAYIQLKTNNDGTFTHKDTKLAKKGFYSPFVVVSLTEKYKLGTGIIKEHRFCIYDDKGEICTTFGEYPKDNIHKNDKDAANAFAYQSHLTYQADKKVLAAGISQGEGIVFYDMSDILHPKKIKEHLYKLPEYTDDSNANSKSVIFKRNSTFGFLALSATDKYCIGLFSGNQVKNWKASRLLLFDWNGNPVKEIKLAQGYEHMTTTESEIILFGTDSESYDYIIHTIKLSDL